MIQGTIIKGIAGFYYVKADHTVFECKARGIFKKDGITPLVGDIVEIKTENDGSAVIHTIHDRKNEFRRPMLSNVDCFIIVIAAAKPEPNLSIIDRFLVMAESNGADAVICINKIDLAEDGKVQHIRSVYENIYPVVCTSALSEFGIDELKALIKDGKYALAGPSGTGNRHC